MSLFDTFRTAAPQSENEIASLEAMIEEETRKQKEASDEIGALYVRLHRQDYTPEFQEYMEKIEASEAAVLEYQGRIDTLNGICRCPCCGAEVDLESAFCSSCGARMHREQDPLPEGCSYCTNCGNLLRKGMRFCTQCGQPVEVTLDDAEDPVTCSAPVEDEQKTAMPILDVEAVSEEPVVEEEVPAEEPVEDVPEVPVAAEEIPEEPVEEVPEAPVVAAEPPVQEAAQPETPSVCPACGAPITKDMRFCIECGQPLQAPAAQEAPAKEEAEVPDGYVACPGCGSYLPQGTDRCCSCGTELEKSQPTRAQDAPPEITTVKCPKCGATVATGMRFCTSCGASLTGEKKKARLKFF